jgi:hypothetical protein
LPIPRAIQGRWAVFGSRREEELMRTEAFVPSATSCAIVLAAIVAAAAIGASSPALALCGVVPSGSSAAAHGSPSPNAGTHSGPTASTHGVSSSSCQSMTNRTVTANVAGGGLAGIHPIMVKTGVIHQNVQTNNLQKTTHTGSTNTKPVRVPKKT